MIEWNEGLNLGIKTIDDDHKKILHVIGKLSEAINNNENQHVIETIFQELLMCTKEHFKREETYLQDCKCTKLEDHKEKHRAFYNKLSKLKLKAISSKDYITSQEITIYLTEWLLNHVIEEDIPTIALLKKCGMTEINIEKDNSLLEKLIKVITDRFSFTKRIFLSAIVPLSGMLLFGSIIIFENFNEYINMEKTSKITHITTNINELVHNLQMERGLNSGYLSSTENKFKDSLKQQRKLVDNAAKEFTIIINNIHISEIKSIEAHIKILKKDILSLDSIRKKIDSKNISQIQEINLYSRIIKNILDITPKIESLNFDRELSSSIATLYSIQQLKESIGQKRAYGTTIIEKKDVTIEEYISFAKLFGTQLAFLSTFKSTASNAQNKRYDALFNSDIVKQINVYEQNIKNYHFDNLDSEIWFKLTTEYINMIKLFEDELLNEINMAINKNINSTIINFILWILFNTTILAINLFILYTFKRSTVMQIDQLTYAMRDLATGGRGFRLSPINMKRDEIAYMYDAYEKTRQKLLKGDIYTQLYLRKNKMELKNKERENTKLEKMAFVDPLTGAVNRRKFEELSTQELERAKRYESNLCFLMLDIDHFKNINDTYGHSRGDEVLKHFSSVCLDMARSLDIVARVGGEEFIIMLPETASEGAYIFAERFREKIYSCEVKVEGQTIKYSVSIGIACLDKDKDVKEILQKADRALYEAKASGRNCSVIYT
ncbi:bacteriohemerythrin [Sulfurimonas sp. CS5]|uniref:bacteriohemerythrin n=1 Tax=Sulfurimonas sp. CS5 TaxID=3391145 RepID=UPI0039EA68AB